MSKGQENDPESESDFKKAYLKLVQKLGKEDGTELLVPKEDLLKYEP